MHQTRLWILPVLAIAAVQFAAADTFLINADNLSGGLCSATAPCGTITVEGTSTLQVTIDLNPGFGIFGNDNAFGFNVAGSTAGVTMSNFSSSLFNGNGGSGNEDGWGNFEFRVSGPGGSSAVSSLSFDVTRTGTPFTGPSDIEPGQNGSNPPGFTVFAMHIINTGSGLTGYAGDSAVGVPEPGTILLLGASLAGLAAWRGFRKRAV
jgi:hypothetical protein